LAGDLVIESRGSAAIVTPHHAVIRRLRDSITA
jgi:hypothetical protein